VNGAGVASFIGGGWFRKDIKIAWNAASSATLSVSEKQTLFNDLWS